MKPKTAALLEKIQDRPVLVWGARMTGIGFLRFARTHKLNVIGFVDSDPALVGRRIADVLVSGVETVVLFRKSNDRMLVLIAVSIKEDEIAGILHEQGIPEVDCIRYSDYCGMFYTIDVVGFCNLRCPSCVHGSVYMNSPKGVMRPADFTRIVDKMMAEMDLVSHVCLYSWGEPFFHPQLSLFIGMLHDRGIAAAVSTNMCIASSQAFGKIVRAAPDYLKVSLSGYYPEVYNTTHTGGDINLVKSNLYRLRHLIDRHKLDIYVDVNYHLYKNNHGRDLEKMTELCKELGFILSTCYANVTPVERLINYCKGRIRPEEEDLYRLLLVDVGKGLEIAKSPNRDRCRFLTNQININWDRSVPLCCVCSDRSTTIVSEDYLRDSIDEIARNRLTHPLCAECLRCGIPAYLMGFNQPGWKKEAARAGRRNAVSRKSTRT